jgi:hypothetical protein
VWGHVVAVGSFQQTLLRRTVCGRTVCGRTSPRRRPRRSSSNLDLRPGAQTGHRLRQPIARRDPYRRQAVIALTAIGRLGNGRVATSRQPRRFPVVSTTRNSYGFTSTLTFSGISSPEPSRSFKLSHPDQSQRRSTTACSVSFRIVTGRTASVGSQPAPSDKTTTAATDHGSLTGSEVTSRTPHVGAEG